MQAASSLESYLQQPVGTYLSGPTYAVWWRNAGLNGIVLWGRPDEADIHRMACAIDAETPDVVPHVSLVDARRLESVDLAAFNAMAHYVAVRRVEYARFMTKQALLRPGGLAGAAVAGFYAVTSPSYAFSVFNDTDAAFAWLSRESDTPVLEELSDIHARVVGTVPFVMDLRDYLQSRRGVATLAESASSLGLSPRNLQRKLREAQTTYQAECAHVKLWVAKGLLLETNFDLKRIALEVGCGSQQHFSSLFRRHNGVAPSQWRQDAISSAGALDHAADRMGSWSARA